VIDKWDYIYPQADIKFLFHEATSEGIIYRALAQGLKRTASIAPTKGFPDREEPSSRVETHSFYSATKEFPGREEPYNARR
jgi:hypothetical protein